MFCKNCGTEISDTEKFCGKCGTPVETQKTSVATPTTPDLGISSNTSVDGLLAMMFIASAACFLLQIILWFVNFGKYSMSVEQISQSRSGAYSLNNFMEGTPLTSIVIIMMIIAIGMCILPIIKNNLNKRRRMIFTKIVAIVNSLGILFGINCLSDNIERNKNSFDSQLGEGFFEGSWSLTFGGILNIIVTVALIVLLFVISSKTKKANANTQIVTTNING